MWPTEYSLTILLIGLLPLAYAAYVVFRRGLAELTGLGCMGVLFMWMGYHLSPWLYFFTGEWKSSILVENYLDDGLLFSLFSIIAFAAGYEFTMKSFAAETPIRRNIEYCLPPVRAKWLVGLVLLAAVVFVIRTEGFAEAWRSSDVRGAQSWREIDTFGERACQLAAVLYPVASLSLSLTAALYLMQSQTQNKIKRYAFGISCLSTASLEGIWSFSRDAGSPFLILAFVALKIVGRRAIPLACACLAVIVMLGNIGRNYRNEYNPGLANFLDAAVYGRVGEIGDGGEPAVSPNINPMSAIDAWTLKASLLESGEGNGWRDAILLAWNLHPLPSLLLPTAQVGDNLTDVMGTYGTSGVTTPALGELYYALGMCGFALMIPVGMFYAWFEGNLRREPSLAAFICFILCFASFPLGLHNGVRAMSRLPIYALLLYLAERKLLNAGKCQAPAASPCNCSPETYMECKSA